MSLVAQAEGFSPLLPAADTAPADGRRSILRHQADAVALYETGESLSSISRKLGIAWESVAKLLDIAGIRKNNGRQR